MEQSMLASWSGSVKIWDSETAAEIWTGINHYFYRSSCTKIDETAERCSW